MVLLLLFFAILIKNSINIIYLPFFTLTFVKILLLINISTLNYIFKFNKFSILNNNKLKIQAIYYVMLMLPLNISQVYCANDVDYSKTSKTFLESNEKKQNNFY